MPINKAVRCVTLGEVGGVTPCIGGVCGKRAVRKEGWGVMKGASGGRLIPDTNSTHALGGAWEDSPCPLHHLPHKQAQRVGGLLQRVRVVWVVLIVGVGVGG